MAMQRTIVQVMQVRMTDLRPGDVVNKDHTEPRGWFKVVDIQELPNGDISVIAERSADSMNSAPYDIVGVQLAKAVEIPDSALAA